MLLLRSFCRPALALGFLITPLAAERWQVQYLYDETRSSLELIDIHFASAERGVAVGVIDEGRRQRPVALVTSDGGAHWSVVPTSETGYSLAFANEQVGWMVTAKGLWVTHEAGRSWSKLSGTPKGLLRVFFLDEQHGFGVGTRKSAWETRDGGRHWTKIAAAAEPSTRTETTSYTWINFINGKDGVIMGWSAPHRPGRRLPAWIDPDRALDRPELPHLSVTLQTRDAGGHWTADTTSMFGRMTRLRFGPFGLGLGLVEFDEGFMYPSEVYQINTYTRGAERIFREKNRAVTDVAVTNSGSGFLAGVEVEGQLRFEQVASKVKILRSPDLTHWSEMEVDYRALGSRVMLAVVDEDHAWAATNTGIILRLVR